MSAHAFLAPSSAARWVRCALAPALEAAHPEAEQSPEALEGTAAHWVAAAMAMGRPPLEGSQAPNGVAVTQEMLEGGRLLVDTLASLGNLPWQVETPLAIPSIHPRDNWGTPDLRAWGARELYIIDYKFGHGIVEAYENWQEIDYAAGCFDEANVNGLDDQQIIVHLGIIQPRGFHRDGPVRWWHVRGSDLRAYFNTLRNAAQAATGPDPKGAPTVEGCADCRGRHACEALQRSAYVAADQAGQWGAVNLTPAEAGVELRTLRRAAKQLEARISGLEAQVVAAIKSGVPVPLWALESVPARLEWSRPLPEVFALGDLLSVDLRKPVDAVTPTQAKAIAKAAKLPENVFEGFAKRPPGAAKLTEQTGVKAALTFAGGVL